MGKGPETLFKERIRPLIEALPNTVVFKIQQVAINGTPDMLCCINGAFVALELKASAKEKVTALQRHYLEKIVGCKGIAFIAYPDNWPEIYNYLKELSVYEKEPVNNVIN